MIKKISIILVLLFYAWGGYAQLDFNHLGIRNNTGTPFGFSTQISKENSRWDGNLEINEILYEGVDEQGIKVPMLSYQVHIDRSYISRIVPKIYLFTIPIPDELLIVLNVLPDSANQFKHTIFKAAMNYNEVARKLDTTFYPTQDLITHALETYYFLEDGGDRNRYYWLSQPSAIMIPYDSKSFIIYGDVRMEVFGISEGFPIYPNEYDSRTICLGGRIYDKEDIEQEMNIDCSRFQHYGRCYSKKYTTLLIRKLFLQGVDIHTPKNDQLDLLYYHRILPAYKVDEVSALIWDDGLNDNIRMQLRVKMMSDFIYCREYGIVGITYDNIRLKEPFKAVKINNVPVVDLFPPKGKGKKM